jgi:hypothetical protein
LFQKTQKRQKYKNKEQKISEHEAELCSIIRMQISVMATQNKLAGYMF